MPTGITGNQKALMFALAGVGRAGAMRAGYTSPKTFLAINGVEYATNRAVDANKVLDGTLAITETQSQTPNKAAFTMQGAEPSEGQDVIVRLGSVNNLERQFAGTVLNRTHRYIGTPAAWNAPVNCIDYSWQFTRRRFSGTFTNASVATIAAAIVAVVPGGFTIAVDPALPVITAITFDDVDALSALAALATQANGHIVVTYGKVVKLFGIDASVTNPTPLSSMHVSLTAFSYTRDLSPVRTRYLVTGGGVKALTDVAVGDSIVPVTGTAWFSGAGGTVKTGPQRLTYSSVTQAAPATAPVVAGTNGAGKTNGAHQWAETYVTAAGESVPSPISTPVVMGTIATPGAIDSANAYQAGPGIGGPQSGLTVKYALSASAENPPVNRTVLGSIFTYAPAGDTYYRPVFTATAAMVGYYINIYRSDDGGTTWYRFVNDIIFITAARVGLQLGTNDNFFHASNLGVGQAAWASTATINQAIVPLSIGPPGTTARKVYATAVGATQLQLAGTVADDVTASFTDTVADGSLGANAPTVDTSGLAVVGLSVTSGAAAAGATSITVGSAASFQAGGGWVQIGSLFVRYTGTGATTLTGIPASGLGSIATAIPSGTPVQGLPALVGIPTSGAGSIQYAIKAGDAVTVHVQCDDTAAQTALATLIGGGDDGVVEDSFNAGAVSAAEATAQGLAQLALKSLVRVTIACKVRDPNAHVGRLMSVNLGSPTSLTATLLIQSVTIDTFQPALFPTYTVQASSDSFTLEDVLRLTALKKAA